MHNMDNDYDQIEILLVEDNPEDAEMAMRAFKKHNLSNRVVLVTDGEEALDYVFSRGSHSGRVNRANPRMILLDLNLPKIDGLEVLKVLKGDPSTGVIPVVVLTSSREEKDMVESYRLGVNSYIVKPVDFDKFVESVRDIGYYWLVLNKLP